MFKKFRFFKRFKKLVFGSFAIVSGAIACCLLGSWTIDQNGNLVGDNLWNTNLQDVVFQGNRTRWANRVYIEAGTYSLQVFGLIDTDYAVAVSSTQNTGATVGNDIFDGGWNQVTFTTTANGYIGLVFKYTNNSTMNVPSKNYAIQNAQVMLNKGQPMDWEPYGVWYSESNYNALSDDYNDLEQDYNDLANMRIDYRNYVINLINYPTSQTTENYTIVQTLDSQAYINDYGFLDVYSITLLSGFGDTWDGIAVSTELSLNTYNYNLLFNGSGSPNLDFALYYDYYGNDSFSVLPLTNIVGDSYYYGYFDLVGLFGKSNLELDMQNVIYNKFVLHWTNNPSPSDLFDIKLNSSDGYNQGYAQGQREFFQKYEELRQDYNNINNQLNTLQSNFDGLQQRYNDLANTDLGFSMSKLMWNIASTPFESFKSIWSVNFLDFNIASFITGILSIFVIVWLLKKIF